MKKMTGARHGLGSEKVPLKSAFPSGMDSGTRPDWTTLPAPPPLQETTTRPLATGFVPSGVRTRPSDLKLDATVGEELGVALVDGPGMTGAGHPGDDRAGSGQADEPRVKDLAAA